MYFCKIVISSRNCLNIHTVKSTKNIDFGSKSNFYEYKTDFDFGLPCRTKRPNTKHYTIISAIFDLEEIESELKSKSNPDHLPLTIILENIRTPDNVGALTRIAAAAGCQKIITTKVKIDLDLKTSFHQCFFFKSTK